MLTRSSRARERGVRLLLLVLEVLEVAVRVLHFVDAVLDKVLVRLLEPVVAALVLFRHVRPGLVAQVLGHVLLRHELRVRDERAALLLGLALPDRALPLVLLLFSTRVRVDGAEVVLVDERLPHAGIRAELPEARIAAHHALEAKRHDEKEAAALRAPLVQKENVEFGEDDDVGGYN